MRLQWVRARQARAAVGVHRHASVVWASELVEVGRQALKLGHLVVVENATHLGEDLPPQGPQLGTDGLVDGDELGLVASDNRSHGVGLSPIEIELAPEHPDDGLAPCNQGGIIEDGAVVSGDRANNAAPRHRT